MLHDGYLSGSFSRVFPKIFSLVSELPSTPSMDFGESVWNSWVCAAHENGPATRGSWAGHGRLDFCVRKRNFPLLNSVLKKLGANLQGDPTKRSKMHTKQIDDSDSSFSPKTTEGGQYFRPKLFLFSRHRKICMAPSEMQSIMDSILKLVQFFCRQCFDPEVTTRIDLNFASNAGIVISKKEAQLVVCMHISWWRWGTLLSRKQCVSYYFDKSRAARRKRFFYSSPKFFMNSLIKSSTMILKSTSSCSQWYLHVQVKSWKSVTVRLWEPLCSQLSRPSNRRSFAP